MEEGVNTILDAEEEEPEVKDLEPTNEASDHLATELLAARDPLTAESCAANGCKHCMVRLRFAGRCAEYCADAITVNNGDDVVVDCERGLTMGKVLMQRDCDACRDDCPLPKINRLASDTDHEIYAGNLAREREAFIFCQERIVERNLPMKLLGVEFMLNGSKAIFYFFSDGRVDFRALVKDLAQHFRTRIEMRQIGVRDGAKILGGLGICGRELCCASWLSTFEPVSIRMAKDQNLSLNPQKVSGLCGRLMCCLVYEQATYTLLRKGLPKIGKKVLTPAGEGRVREVNVILRQTKVDVAGETFIFTVDDDGNFVPVIASGENSKAKPLDSRSNRQETLLASPIAPLPMDDDNSVSNSERISAQSSSAEERSTENQFSENSQPESEETEREEGKSLQQPEGEHDTRDNHDNRETRDNRGPRRNQNGRHSGHRRGGGESNHACDNHQTPAANNGKQHNKNRHGRPQNGRPHNPKNGASNQNKSGEE